MPENPKSQHYVHRAYLEGFCDPQLEREGKSAVWMYMPNKSPFPQRPERVARRNYYYCYQDEERRNFRTEHDLQKMEDLALPALRRIREGDFSLNSDDRLTFAGYIALAHTRVPTFQKYIDRLSCLVSAKQLELIANSPRASALTAAKISEQTGEHIDPDDLVKQLTGGTVEITQENRGWSLGQMFNTMLWLQEWIFRMSWTFLLCPSDDQGFLTSDNPVSLFDPVGERRGEIGFASSPAAHFTFPLSSSICFVGYNVQSPSVHNMRSFEVRQINRGTISRAESQLYAPFKSAKVQTLLDKTVANKIGSGKVLFSKGRVVEA
jgi:Protein of unknown function (DUF4238)